MKIRMTAIAALGMAFGLAACAVETTSSSQVAASGVPRVAEQACVNLVNRNNANTSARVTGSEFSEANSLVMLTDAGGTSWRCLVSNRGEVADLRVVEAGGATAAGTASREEQACLAAVSNAANNGDVGVLSSEFSQAGTLVMVGVGPQRAPWRCIAYSDGTTGDVMFMGEG